MPRIDCISSSFSPATGKRGRGTFALSPRLLLLCCSLGIVIIGESSQLPPTITHTLFFSRRSFLLFPD